jgi:DNA-directed RNA polymerase specialized sigma24 family protein
MIGRVKTWHGPRQPSRPLTPEQSELAADVFRYARAVLLDIGVTDDDAREDLSVDVALSAARHFRVDRGCKSIYSFAAWLCRTKLMHRPVRQMRKKNGMLQALLRPLPSELVAAAQPNPYELEDEYRQLVKGLPLRSRVVMRLWSEGWTDPEQGQVFGLTKEGVRQIRKRAFEAIRTSPCFSLATKAGV